MELYLQYLIICPLVMLAGFVDAIAGGGGLISLPAYLIAGVPIHQAIGTNKMSASMGTLLATYKYGQNGYISWRIAALAIPFAFGGSWCGAKLALLLDAHVFLILMLIILPLTGLYVLYWKPEMEEKEPFSFQKTALLTAGATFFIGMYDGFYGPGTGTFLLLLLTSMAHIPLREANGITKVLNSTTNIAALSVFLLNGKILFPLGIIAGLFGMAGNYLGTRMFTKGGATTVRPVILLVLTVFFLKIIYELYILP